MAQPLSLTAAAAKTLSTLCHAPNPHSHANAKPHGFFSSKPLHSLQSLSSSSLPLPKKLFLGFPLQCSYSGASLSSSASPFDYEHERVVYPRPAEIPWSKELCNSVQLIGIVGTPIQIKHLSSGKVLAWSRLAVKKSATDTVWINLTFWDELAHVAFQHVEKGQQIYVSGRLVSDTVEGDDEKRQTYYKVVVQQLNFVERTYSPVSLYEPETNSVTSGGKAGNFSRNHVGSTEELWQAFFANPVDWWDNRKNKRNPKYPDFKHKHTGEALWIEGKYNPHWVKSQLAILDSRMESLHANEASNSRSSWDPTVSLILKHPTLVLLEKYRSRAHFKQILAQMMRIHLVTETFPMSRLLFSSTSHLESLDMAILLFNHYTPQPNLYIYNIMICALSFSPIDSIALFKSMLQSCIYPDKQTLLYLLKAAKCLSVGLQIHAHAIITGFSSHVYLQNSLIKMYAENGRMDLAHQVFQQMIEQDAVSWNIMISGHTKNGGSLQALEFFRKMGVSGLKPDEFTAVSLFTACGQLGDARQGKSVHAWIERRKCIALNLIVGNALLDMYVKLEELELARRVFDRAEVRDCISWNTMIAGYAKVGELEFACKLFNEMPSRDLVSWNSLIAGYAQKGDCRAVMKLFRDMLVENIRPDKVTIVGLVSTAAEMGALHQGRWVHGWLVKNQMKLDAFLGSALIDMYSKCGSIERAFMVFERISERDVMVWTAMIAGLAFHGYGNKALELFREMQEGLTPNAVTLLAILTACSHSGMVDQGHAIFYSMKQISGVEPGIEHYGCLVDLLGRAGRLAEARDVIEKMPMKPSRTIWGAMLSACKAHGNVGLAEIALRELLKLEPEKEGGYVLLSNVYAACGKWSSSDNIRGIMESRGVKKRAGCSSVVVDGVAHEFVAADKRHSRWVEIYCILKSLNREMRSGADISLKFQQQLLDPYLG